MVSPAIALVDLLTRALSVGAQEVRLEPGRRVIVVLPQGESEVRGDPQTSERIDDLIKPVIPPDSRRALASGWAEWEFDLDGKGPVRACAELKVGLLHVSLFLDRCMGAPAAPLGAPPAQKAPQRPAQAPAPMRAREPEPEPLEEIPQAPRLPTQPPIAPNRLVYDTGLAGGTTAEIDRLLFAMLEKKASDLHISTGSPPMLRVDGEMVAIAGEKSLSAEAL